MKKVLAIAIITVFAILSASASYAAQEAKKNTPAPAPMTRPVAPQLDRNVIFLNGVITKIDTSDPKAVKVEVMNNADKKTHMLEVGPMTNVLKVIEVSELKSGDKVRSVARNTESKEIAMSLVTGNLKETTRPMPARAMAPEKNK